MLFYAQVVLILLGYFELIESDLTRNRVVVLLVTHLTAGVSLIFFVYDLNNFLTSA